MDHALSKLRLEHLVLSPFLIPFRMAHQLPILYDNTINGYDVNIPASKMETARTIKPSDVTFYEDKLKNYQYMFAEYEKEEFLKISHGLSNRLRKWAVKHFKDKHRRAFKICYDYSSETVQKMIYSMPMSKLLNGYESIIFVCSENNRIIMLLDHYVCDGITLFNFINAQSNLTTPTPPFPNYYYIPFISDALLIEYLLRNGMGYLKYPSQIQNFNRDFLTPSFKIVRREDIDCEWNRWNNYGECLLNIFEKFEGVENALGESFINPCTNNQSIAHNAVPSHFNVFLTVGINTNTCFGNNRIGGIIVTVKRPDPHLDRTYRREDIAIQFKTQCTKHFTDAIVSYDMLRGFDTTIMREFGCNKIDIIFTSFKMPYSHKKGFGGFIGTESAPFMYISSKTSDTESTISYSTNWF